MIWSKPSFDMAPAWEWFYSSETHNTWANDLIASDSILASCLIFGFCWLEVERLLCCWVFILFGRLRTFWLSCRSVWWSASHLLHSFNDVQDLIVWLRAKQFEQYLCKLTICLCFLVVNGKFQWMKFTTYKALMDVWVTMLLTTGTMATDRAMTYVWAHVAVSIYLVRENK